MSLQQIARDDEEIRCVSPQSVVPAASSRVLPFRPVTLSDGDRWRLLSEHDPDYAAYLSRMRDMQLARYGF